MNLRAYFKGSANGHAPQRRSQEWSIGDPALAEYLGLARTSAGVAVTEGSSLGLTAVFRAVSIISGTIAGLPLKTYRRLGDERRRTPSFLEEPGGPGGLTPFEWKELVMVHLLLHGNAYLVHAVNGAGAVAGLQPVHPFSVTVKAEPGAPGGKVFELSMADGTRRQFTTMDLTHIHGLSTDGLRGLSPISAARNALGTALAGDEAAARMFANGMMLGGLVSSDESLTEAQAEDIKVGLKAKLSGSQHAGDIAVINASLKFSPWTMSAVDAQFIESRAYQVEEVSRIFGVPPHLLAQTEKQTSWGTGVAEQNLGFARYTLMAWTSRIEERLSRLLIKPRFAEFDYSGMLQGTPREELELLGLQLDKGILTIDEVRRVRNLPPLPPAAPPTKEVTP